MHPTLVKNCGKGQESKVYSVDNLKTYIKFYGDKLPIFHDYIPTKSIDPIYVDPPCNSNRNYNVRCSGSESGRTRYGRIRRQRDSN